MLKLSCSLCTGPHAQRLYIFFVGKNAIYKIAWNMENRVIKGISTLSDCFILLECHMEKQALSKRLYFWAYWQSWGELARMK